MTSLQQSRRSFIIKLGSLAAASVFAGRNAVALDPLLYPPADLSCFDKPITPAASEIRYGYAAITWGGDDPRAIREISEVGYRGIQLRSNILKEFGDKPGTVADLLKQHRLQFVALSGGGPGGPDYVESEVVTTQARHAAFLREAGGLYLQITDSARPKDRRPTAGDFERFGGLLTKIGRRATDLGIETAYHNHMHSIGQSPEEVDAILAASDPRYVKLLLDVAHYTQGGGDPVDAIRKYRDRLLFLHIKDVESVAGGSDSYRFVELGRGRVDLPAVFHVLKEISFRGWAIIELDSVPDKARTPKDSAVISKNYLKEKLGITI
jgi:inosose dehydratase